MEPPLLLLLSRFSRVRLCATAETAAHQASPSLGFSRQEHWSGLPSPSLQWTQFPFYSYVSYILPNTPTASHLGCPMPQMTKSFSIPWAGGMVCGRHRKSTTVRIQVLLSPEFRGGRRLWPASCEVISATRAVFSGVHITKSKGFVFLILLLYLRETCRPLTDMLTLSGHVAPVF